MAQFRLPDLGEGLEEAQLVQWLVAVGDRVVLNQPICQVETAKALVDVPSPYAGIVEKLHAQPGETVPVGASLITIAEEGAPNPPASFPDGGKGEHEATEGSGPVLVGYGSGGPAQSYTRRRRGANLTSQPPSLMEGRGSQVPRRPVGEGAGGEVHASPLVRKMAAERGIDLSAIRGSGPGGRIRVEDLEAADLTPQPPSLTEGRGSKESPRPQEEAAGGEAEDEERISTVGLRKAIAARMVRSATTIPQFTEYGIFEATALVALRERLRADPAYAGVHLTYLPLLVGALVLAVREYPIMNSRWDEEGNAIVLKRGIHVGIATDTERGLLVPVIHNAHTLTLRQIAEEAERLVGLAREGRLDAHSLTGSTITLTNVGAAGPVETGAPLINPPEVCVVGFGAIKPRPAVVGERVEVRPGAWISMSCDHRVVDGATAAKFLAAIAGHLETPDALVQLGAS